MTATVHASHCPLDCPDLCSLHVEVENDRVVNVDGSEVNPNTKGFICAKVRRLPELLYGPDRLLYPAVRDGNKGEGRFKRVGWDEALSLLAAKMQGIKSEYGGEAIVPACYGGSNGVLTQDAADLRFFRRLGSAQCVRSLCAAPTGAAFQALYGRMPGMLLSDYVHSKLIVVWGYNPHATGIHLLPVVDEALQRGAKLVVVDPVKTKLAQKAHLHLPVKPGSDVALALSVIHWLFERKRADEAFLRAHANGWENLRDEAAQWTLPRAAETCGLAASDIEQFAQLYAGTAPAAIRLGYGHERNRNGGWGAAAVMALPAVAGKFGVLGGGFTMSNSPRFKFNVEGALRTPAPATRTVNLTQLGAALLDEKRPAKLLFVYNLNALATVPAQNKMRKALLRDDLFTVVFDSATTDTARYADLLLPATHYLEHSEMSRGYGMSALLRSQPAAKTPGEGRSNYDVFTELSRRMGLWQDGDEPTAEAFADTLLRVTPDGERWRRELAERGVALPEDNQRVQFVDFFPNTPDKKINLWPLVLCKNGARPYRFAPDPATPEYPLALLSPASGRMITSTFGQLQPGVFALQMNAADMAARGLRDGDTVRAFNALGEVVLPVRCDEALRAGVALLPKGLWARHTLNGATANALIGDAYTDIGEGPCYMDARMQVEKARA